MTVAPSTCLRVLLGPALCLLVLSGCGSGSTYSFNNGDLAQRFLPSEQKVDHHPDTLEALSITESNGRLQFELKNDYEALHRKWSCTYRSLDVGRSRDRKSYATFWSLELSLAALQPEVGITSLSKKQAKQSLQKRRREYANTIQIDVYWFEREGNSLLTAPGNRVELRVNGKKYRPQKESHGILEEAFLPAQTQAALYRRNTFYFPRVVDSTDILKGAQNVELYINRASPDTRVRFAWSWKNEDQANARLNNRRRIRRGE